MHQGFPRNKIIKPLGTKQSDVIRCYMHIVVHHSGYLIYIIQESAI